ncbi:EF-P 5-aminopentanol modification-associated protein YfmH [Fructilactobacillus florum]|uniref:Uncharacterized protein n=1 Tax=Fructilactobacillus florum DSM 22689 = JCM 16035 TaxID=1423745 RepID=A0A0R2CLB0_9LACO|nr:pitrilysin family protein [Fructilactobacillus florum]KRM92429.1 hypothetical protein FC87_GL000041 [Fructilactobacillus florum DSM 22689 = JCM 16035]
MVSHFYPEFNTTVVRKTLTNGLTVILNNKPGFATTYAMVTANFGAADRWINSDDGLKRVPAGLAHFIEHKLFDKQQYDVGNRFAESGADNNAFTSFSQTSYLFSATSAINENLAILADLTLNPYFDEGKVAKEQGIITQEILMYQDDPNSRLYFETIAGLYPETALSDDIAGTSASIQKLTPALLYQTYAQYYQPRNLQLTIVGDFAENKLELAPFAVHRAENPVIDQHQNQQLRQARRAEFASGTTLAKQKFTMKLQRQKVALGFRGRQPKLAKPELVRQDLKLNFFLDAVFSEDSAIYQQLYQTGVIDDTFDYQFVIEPDYQFVWLAADTNQPQVVVKELTKVLQRALQHPELLTKEFALLKREAFGEQLTQMDSVAALANQLGSFTDGYLNIYDETRLIGELSFAEMITSAQEFFANAQTSQTIIA